MPKIPSKLLTRAQKDQYLLALRRMANPSVGKVGRKHPITTARGWKPSADELITLYLYFQSHQEDKWGWMQRWEALHGWIAIIGQTLGLPFADGESFDKFAERVVEHTREQVTLWKKNTILLISTLQTLSKWKTWTDWYPKIQQAGSPPDRPPESGYMDGNRIIDQARRDHIQFEDK